MARGQLAYMPNPGSVEIRTYDLPPVAEGALLLSTVVAGVCGSDVHMFSGAHPLRSIVLGHESLGRVTDPSTRPRDTAGVELAAGDRVSTVYFAACRSCPACARGESQYCIHAYDHWMQSPDLAPHFVGTHGTHYYAGANQALFKVPDNVPSLVAASANCALAQVTAGIERAAVRPGQHVVIQGAGGLGLYATALAKERGATVTVIDAVARRLKTAEAFGADHTISMQDHPDRDDRRKLVTDVTADGADIVLELAGVPAAVPEGIGLLRTGGTFIEIGNIMPGVEIVLDIGDLTRRAISILPVIRYQPRHLQEALQFLSRNVGRLPLADLVDATYPLEDIGGALRDSQDKKINRAAIVFEDLDATSA
jgi:L-iditol 2-dehydrogenase